MKTPSVSPKTTVAVYLVGVIGTFLIMGALVWIMYYFTKPPPVDESRYAERRKNLADINAQAKDQLENYGWMDQAKGIVRLPIKQAMELTVHEWQNPAQARSNLLARLAKATAVTPAAPPPPNIYE